MNTHSLSTASIILVLVAFAYVCGFMTGLMQHIKLAYDQYQEEMQTKAQDNHQAHSHQVPNHQAHSLPNFLTLKPKRSLTATESSLEMKRDIILTEIVNNPEFPPTLRLVPKRYVH